MKKLAAIMKHWLCFYFLAIINLLVVVNCSQIFDFFDSKLDHLQSKLGNLKSKVADFMKWAKTFARKYASNYFDEIEFLKRSKKNKLK